MQSVSHVPQGRTTSKLSCLKVGVQGRLLAPAGPGRRPIHCAPSSAASSSLCLQYTTSLVRECIPAQLLCQHERRAQTDPVKVLRIAAALCCFSQSVAAMCNTLARSVLALLQRCSKCRHFHRNVMMHCGIRFRLNSEQGFMEHCYLCKGYNTFRKVVVLACKVFLGTHLLRLL